MIYKPQQDNVDGWTVRDEFDAIVCRCIRGEDSVRIALALNACEGLTEDALAKMGPRWVVNTIVSNSLSRKV